MPGKGLGGGWGVMGVVEHQENVGLVVGEIWR